VSSQKAHLAGSGGGGSGPDPIATESECVETASLAPARIWLLTDTQYVNIVRDALGEDLDGPISGIEELAARFQTSRRASDCAAATLASNAMGYASKQESCDLSRAKDVLAETGSLPEFLGALVLSRGFVMRDPKLD